MSSWGADLCFVWACQWQIHLVSLMLGGCPANTLLQDKWYSFHPISNKSKLLMATGFAGLCSHVEWTFVPQCLLSCRAVSALAWSYQWQIYLIGFMGFLLPAWGPALAKIKLLSIFSSLKVSFSIRLSVLI